MSKEELINVLVDQYVNIRRARTSKDIDAELEAQEKTLAFKLESFGVAVDRLPNGMPG